MTEKWIPDAKDIAANRDVGFGTTVNVINGGLEAGIPNDYRVKDRIDFYKRYLTLLDLDPNEEQNIDCYDQGKF